MDRNDNRHNGYTGARPVYREIRYDNSYDGGAYNSRGQDYYDIQIRRRMRERRRLQERRRVKRNRTIALLLLIVIVALIAKGCSASKKKKLENAQAESSVAAVENSSAVQEEDNPEQDEEPQESEPEKDKPEVTGGHKVRQIEGMTYVDDILVVNKTYSVPQDYAPGVSALAKDAFEEMASAAMNDGVFIEATTGFVSYEEQKTKYRNSALEVGVAETDWKIERPGFSEHQTGLCFDVNANDPNFSETTQGQWLAAHCSEYGFIIRYPQGKESKTGYDHNPWHIRYVGVEAAKEISSKGQCLEEYLGLTSDYTLAPGAMTQEAYAALIGAPVGRPEGAPVTTKVTAHNDDPNAVHEQPEPEPETWNDDGYTGEDYGYDYGYDPTYDYGYDQTYDYGYDPTYDYYEENYWY